MLVRAYFITSLMLGSRVMFFFKSSADAFAFAASNSVASTVKHARDIRARKTPAWSKEGSMRQSFQRFNQWKMSSKTMQPGKQNCTMRTTLQQLSTYTTTTEWSSGSGASVSGISIPSAAAAFLSSSNSAFFFKYQFRSSLSRSLIRSLCILLNDSECFSAFQNTVRPSSC